ncbi:hypothetical protein STVA_12420 [Allostella vacuolata]|nr:hypothetical protein STVA_12420 [Stella vacuolata]
MLLLALPIAPAVAGDGLAGAREAFARDVAKAYGIARQTVLVQPQYPGLPDNPYDALETPPFLALSAGWPGMASGPSGFAAADGRTVSARNPAAITDLLAAAGIGLRPPPRTDIVRRLMWLYQPDPGNRLIDAHPRIDQVTPPIIEHAADGAVRLSWFVERGGRTGWVGVFRADFHLLPGGKPLFAETFLP